MHSRGEWNTLSANTIYQLQRHDTGSNVARGSNADFILCYVCYCVPKISVWWGPIVVVGQIRRRKEKKGRNDDDDDEFSSNKVQNWKENTNDIFIENYFHSDLTPQTATKRMWVKIIHFRFDILAFIFFSLTDSASSKQQSFFHSSCLSPLLFPLPSAHVAVPSLPEMRSKKNQYPINMNGKVQFVALSSVLSRWSKSNKSLFRYSSHCFSLFFQDSRTTILHNVSKRVNFPP